MEETEQINVGQGVQGDELAEITEEQMLGNLKNDVKAYEKSLENINKVTLQLYRIYQYIIYYYILGNGTNKVNKIR